MLQKAPRLTVYFTFIFKYSVHWKLFLQSNFEHILHILKSWFCSSGAVICNIYGCIVVHRSSVCQVHAHTHTDSPWTKSSGRSFSRFRWIQTSSCFMSPGKHTHTKPIHRQTTEVTGQGLRVKVHGAWFQPPGRCDATEAPGGTRLCLCVSMCMYIYKCMCMLGWGRARKGGRVDWSQWPRATLFTLVRKK